MNKPCLSVIVPVYNAEKYIHDGSPDRCGDICDEYAKQDGRVKVIHKKNGGVSEARNMGLDHARGAYISFVDPDDWIELTMFQETLAFCQQHETDIVCFEVCERKHGGQYVHYRFDKD